MMEIQWMAFKFTFRPDYWVYAQCSCGWESKQVVSYVDEQLRFNEPPIILEQIKSHKKWHDWFPWAEEIA